MTTPAPPSIFTVGHSTLSQADFISLLRENKIGVLADIRRFPASRRHPWFAQEELAAAARSAGIEYRWFQALGGFRGKAREDSPNAGLRVAGFRNYADYMETPEFEGAVGDLMRLARARLTAYMCAEAMYWSCHRMILSDYLTAHGWEVIHIMGSGKLRRHQMTDCARIVNGRLFYPPATPPLFC